MLVKVGMWVLGLVYLAWGAPAIVAPQWFFDHFPGLGQHWTAGYPPFNEHLMTDVGVAAVVLGGLLIAGALIGDHKVTAVTLGAVAFYEGLHLIYHLVHHGSLTTVSLNLSLASLAAGVIFPLALLVADRARHRRGV